MPNETQADSPLWIRAAVDEAAFQHEQASFATLWNFVGFRSDIPKDQDWFRTTVGTRSIFVQRFGETIRAFENRCAHRFYPLRTKDKGNGPVVCGYHHWRYNAEGKALGIPKCQEYFGKIPRDMDAQLVQLDIDFCGELMFARFPGGVDAPSLRDYLAEAFPILQLLCTPVRPPYRHHMHAESNWKLLHHISLDDYHVVAVHPTTFGKNGYLDVEGIKYYRFGRHSAYYSQAPDDYFVKTIQDAMEGKYKPHHYAIYNVFPNLVISQFCYTEIEKKQHWFTTVIRYRALTATSTQISAWVYWAPDVGTGTKPTIWQHRFWDPIFLPLLSHYARQIMQEDNVVCQHLQTVAHQIDRDQTLASIEERIGWFEESYAQALSGQPFEASSAIDTTSAATNLDASITPSSEPIAVAEPVEAETVEA